MQYVWGKTLGGTDSTDSQPEQDVEGFSRHRDSRSRVCSCDSPPFSVTGTLGVALLITAVLPGGW
jgi:hypothetical protein